MRHSLPLIFSLLALTLPTAAAPPPATQLRVSLIHGQNSDITDNLQECTRFRESLVKLFGYKSYELLGTSTAQIAPDTAVLISPTRIFKLRMEPDPVSPRLFHFHLFKEEEPLFRGKFVPKDNVPLIIRGPEYHRGILIIVVNKENP